MIDQIAIAIAIALSAAMHTSMVVLAERIFGGRPLPPGAASDAAARRWIQLAALAGTVTALAVAFRYRDSSLLDGTLVPAIGAAAGIAATVVRPWAARWLTFALTSSSLMVALTAWNVVAIGLRRETALVIAASASIAVVAGARGTRIAAGIPWVALPPPPTDPARRAIDMATLAALASTLCLAVVWKQEPYGAAVAVAAIGVAAGIAARRSRPHVARWLVAVLIAANLVPAAVAAWGWSAAGAAVSYLVVAMGVSAIIAMGAGARGIGIARSGGAGA